MLLFLKCGIANVLIASDTGALSLAISLDDDANMFFQNKGTEFHEKE